MASSSTHRKSEHVPDSELLDYDDVDFQINPAEVDNLGAQTPRAGKKIRMNSPPPRSPSSSSSSSSRSNSPHRTPPRHLPNPESPSRINCQTNILIHTNEKCSLQLITTASYKTDPYFHTLKSSMENLITRAEMTLMQQEPFHTLLSQGYTFNISQPQLSYKTKDQTADEIMDYVVDMSKLTSGRNRTAIPHLTTTSGNTQIANVDISFKFHIQPFTGVRKSRLADSCERLDVELKRDVHVGNLSVAGSGGQVRYGRSIATRCEFGHIHDVVHYFFSCLILSFVG